ncbi:MAG TPA: hypothetical protein VGR91_09265 [Stellaceae bacterium]|nr:hypothetical protein [Stellaceae bacterium]
MTVGFDVRPRRERVDPRSEIARNFPAITELRKMAKPEIHAIQKRLSDEEALGADTSGLRQALRELCWWLEYTGDAAGGCAALTRVRRYALMPAPPSALHCNEDGSYGIPTEIWFLKLDASVDQMLAEDPGASPRPARFLDRINDPHRLQSYFEELFVSHPAEDGLDRRKELNLSSANLVRLILRRRPADYPWDRRLEGVVHRFIADWQDPMTGFFGAAYELGGRVLRTTDLSITFHIARYLDGAIAHWRKLADTLFAIRDEIYPYGWLDEEGMTSHNNYDVATLLRLGWNAMRADQRRRAAHELDRLLSWCLDSAIAEDGTVVARAVGESLPESYYFAIAFLDTLGFFGSGAPFWRDGALPRAGILGARLEAKVRALERRNPMTQMALARLHARGCSETGAEPAQRG